VRLLDAVENDPSDPPAEQDAKKPGPRDEVRDLLRREIRVATGGKAFVKPVGDERGRDVRQAVPSRSDLPDAEDERTECV
jgi:hypothetical protein